MHLEGLFVSWAKMSRAVGTDGPNLPSTMDFITGRIIAGAVSLVLLF